jgi:YVTN family beta-propeller protein
LWSAAATAQPFVYVADLGSDDVLVIDAATLGPVASLPFGEDPDGLAVSPDGRRVYVAGFLSNTVGEIDAETHQLLATVPVGEGPVGLAVTPDGARVYVTQRGADSVAAIGVASGTVEAVIPVGRGPNAIAITPDGTTAFVTNSFAPLAGEVSVLDLATDQVRNTITVGRKPSRVAITPDGRTAYVTNFRSWTSTAIDVASETVRTTFRAGLKSSAVAVNPNGAWAYIIDQRGGISIVDVSVDQVTRSIEIGGGIGGIAILRNGGTAYVARSTLQVVDLGEEEVVAEVAVGDRPFAVAANCVGDGCTETPYTPKPTKTATETPTVTPTPTATLTLTVTATVTPTRTLESGQTHVLFTLSTDPTTAGEDTLLSLQLETGGQVVHGIRERVALTDSIGVPNRGGALDCGLAPGIEAQRAEFSLVSDACGSFCDALDVTIDFDQPLSGTFAIYSCRLTSTTSRRSAHSACAISTTPRSTATAVRCRVAAATPSWSWRRKHRRAPI